MSAFRVVIYGDGTDELGEISREYGSDEELPALPRLVHRVLAEPAGAAYRSELLRRVKGAYRSDIRWAERNGRARRLSQKARQAIRLAKDNGFDAVVILVDRDRLPSQDQVGALARARDDMVAAGFIPCAVGQAVEAFDAWMIADGNAVGAIEGALADQTHPRPEKLDGEEGTGRHPKDRALHILGGRNHLWAKYAVIAARADLDVLKRCCPEGFQPFAGDVTRHLPTT